MKFNNALVLFSGGQDSTACVLLSKKLFHQVHTLSFDYGQTHDLSAAELKELSQKLGAQSHFHIHIPNYGQWVKSDLLTNVPYEGADAQATEPLPPQSDCPSTFVPGRNLLFINIAGIYAYQRNLDTLVLGVSQVDYSGYPDCRGPFIAAAQKSLQLALDRPIGLFAPLIDMNKADIWALIDQLADIEEIDRLTKTCYETIFPAPSCEKCAACRLRIRGLHQFKADPEVHHAQANLALDRACGQYRFSEFIK